MHTSWLTQLDSNKSVIVLRHSGCGCKRPCKTVARPLDKNASCERREMTTWKATSNFWSISLYKSTQHTPLVTLNGGVITPVIVSSTVLNGFSPYTIVYKVTPSDHISNSGPRYLKIENIWNFVLDTNERNVNYTCFRAILQESNILEYHRMLKTLVPVWKKLHYQSLQENQQLQ